MQILWKLLVTLFLLVPVVGGLVGIVRVWRSSVNVEAIPDALGKKFTTPPALPLRDDDALYRSGTVIGRVEGVVIDEAAGRVGFARVKCPGGDQTTAEAVVFRHYRLGTPASGGSVTGTDEFGRVYE